MRMMAEYAVRADTSSDTFLTTEVEMDLCVRIINGLSNVLLTPRECPALNTNAANPADRNTNYHDSTSDQVFSDHAHTPFGSDVLVLGGTLGKISNR